MAGSCEKELLTRLSEGFIYDRYVGRLLERKTLRDLSTLTTRGYRQIYVEGVPYLLHRLIFFYHYGRFPKVVDHIDGDLSNNCIENLQGCSQSVNIEKARIFKTNKTGYKGVSFNKKADKFEAYYWKDYKKYYVGLFDTAEEASKAREKRKYNGKTDSKAN
jgi:hypothetical protein